MSGKWTRANEHNMDVIPQTSRVAGDFNLVWKLSSGQIEVKSPFFTENSSLIIREQLTVDFENKITNLGCLHIMEVMEK